MSNNLVFRTAESSDLPNIIEMLTNDEVASSRESKDDSDIDSYAKALAEIDLESNNNIFVVEIDQSICACFQLTIIRCLTYKGGRRLLVEGVRVESEQRGLGIGKKVFEWIKDYALQNKCHLIQLTTDRNRPEALKFYESLGYKNSHNGLKLHL